MSDLSKLCLGCMREKPDYEPVCPHCNFNGENGNEQGALPLKTVLEEKYIVGKMLSKNGEGYTYLGYDISQKTAVRIREYCPAGLCERINLTVKPLGSYEESFSAHKMSFLALARSLARMRGLTALFPVYDIFEANGTAYYISETVETITLRDFLIRNNGILNFEQMRTLFMPIMSTLSSLHQVDIIHRGISPDTLVVGKDGKIRITEFCVPDARTAGSDMHVQLFKGYAAIEQYGFDGEQGPWTDVYALASVVYRVLVGSPPPEANARVTNDRLIIPPKVADSLSAYVISALTNAMQIMPSERTQSIEAFRDELSASPSVISRANERVQDKAVKEKQSNKKKSSSLKYAVVSMLVTIIIIAIIGTGIYLFLWPKGEESNTSEEVTTVPASTTVDYSSLIPDPNTDDTPDLVNSGMTYQEFLSSSDTIKLRQTYSIVVESKKYDDSKAGTILSQEPAAGTKIQKGDTIKIVISLGTEKFAMPNVMGLTKEEALLKLYEVGIPYENVVFESRYDANGAPASVVYCNPAIGEAISADEYITISINSRVETTAPSTAVQTDAPDESSTAQSETTTKQQ
ncbi:MAG: PASTA domain-containing protein [Clostridia bacterium]|nr:PASTA domain-containing protein [Clostridia bacterium]MEE1024222.1 PASTA domain-containing protein [Acutalibacteraceae bacterium]